MQSQQDKWELIKYQRTRKNQSKQNDQDCMPQLGSGQASCFCLRLHISLSLFFPADWLSHALSSWQDGEPNLPRVYSLHFLRLVQAKLCIVTTGVTKWLSVPKHDASEMTLWGGLVNLPKLPGHQCRINFSIFKYKVWVIENNSCRILIIWKN